ncbi:MAG: hypothetical protein IJZ95_04960 [Oscillospiraceae bacterium]|nr:hypothetical protein [Oscillospiraceae bacterium]
MRSLERAHPLCCFVYLAAVLGITIFTRDPIALAESAVGAALLLILSGNIRIVIWLPVVTVVSAVTNPVFVHRGDTVLFFAGDLPVTAEAVLYGAVFGLMISAAAGWSINAVKYITTDKYIWLFGRMLPVSGLVLSCGLRLVPLFIRRTRDFSASQGAVGIRDTLKAFSASVGYSAEEAMTSADSMRARGYGTARRTSYSLYRLGGRETVQLLAVVLVSVSAVSAMICGGGAFEFYPAVSGVGLSAADMLLYIAFGIMCVMPSCVILHENIKRSRIGCYDQGALK